MSDGFLSPIGSTTGSGQVTGIIGKAFYDAGRIDALDAAEAAVNEVLDRTPNSMNGEYITVSKHFPADLIAAIDALRGER